MDNQQIPRRPLLDTAEAARYLGINPRTLEWWRTTGRERIPFVRAGRVIRYDVSDLDAWVERKRVGGEWVQRELDVDTEPLPESC